VHPSAAIDRLSKRAFVHDNGQPQPAYQELLSRPIRELGLKLEGSPVERFVAQLYRELDDKGLT